MYVLGLEGTAHTVSASVLDEVKIYSLVSKTYRPEEGGINPRDAADFHFSNIVEVIRKAISDSGISPEQISLISFSKGPGLPPSLKVVATAARALSIKYGIPIVGVNHPLGHIEIGRRETGCNDPVMLYVSGGNTQIIAYKNGHYRVFGETLDIGVGNLLDKIARDMGFPFPGGPEIEAMALGGLKLLDLPYTVKGMDTAFSGIYTAASQMLKRGERKEDVCMSIQEYAFSMLVETLERAIFTTGKKSILLAGGVARNKRLRTMIQTMAEEAGVEVFETPDKYCMDNGAMIGQAGLLTYKARGADRMEDTKIDQFFRIDQAYASWVKEEEIVYRDRGAESIIRRKKFHQFEAIEKERIPKGYRNEEIDLRIRRMRMKREITMLERMARIGISVPYIFSVDLKRNAFMMEYIDGKNLGSEENIDPEVPGELGRMIGMMHGENICHGDLTMNNIMVRGKRVFLIDPSMGSVTDRIQDFAYDMRLLNESSVATLKNGEKFMQDVMGAYRKHFKGAGAVIEEMKRIEGRRRYV
ncbi:bifunctional N(6)-L-threonylcarbamoyladenine synthase/serine/threonine protein kinase [Cuniculiplasma sp. SKW4]|uniref:bifunctional N(6)-L-threonylcarbamoyladenine synthase/serine/threonine protein kinase n=1 Tax=Cuniculiplasma sp. SKW4 TaxID=3400171 RepID=UPI003FD3627A